MNIESNPLTTSLQTPASLDAENLPNLESLYGLRIGGLGCLYDGNIAVEVTDPVSVSPLPNVENWIVGLVNLRGNLIPLFDVKVYLGMIRKTDAFSGTSSHTLTSSFRSNVKFLVFGDGNRMAAILIDELPARHEFIKGQTMAGSTVIPDKLKDVLVQVRSVENEEWYELSFDALFRNMGMLQTNV